MKSFAVSILLGTLLGTLSAGVVVGEPSKSPKATHRSYAKHETSIGVDTLKANDADEIAKENNSGWNGSYVGVNAGTSFGATVGKNVVIPLGSDSDK